MSEQEYACAPIKGVEPVFVPHMLRGAMTLRFLRQVPGLDVASATDAAIATWETDWPDDPEPRTFDSAVEAVDSELQHWDES